jgi:hypothetical protein
MKRDLEKSAPHRDHYSIRQVTIQTSGLGITLAESAIVN